MSRAIVTEDDRDFLTQLAMYLLDGTKLADLQTLFADETQVSNSPLASPTETSTAHGAGATGIPDLGRVAAEAFGRRRKACEWKKWKAWALCFSWPIIYVGRGVKNVETLYNQINIDFLKI